MDVLSLQGLIFDKFHCGDGGLENTDHCQFSFWDSVVVLKGLTLENFHFGSVALQQKHNLNTSSQHTAFTHTDSA